MMANNNYPDYSQKNVSKNSPQSHRLSKQDRLEQGKDFDSDKYRVDNHTYPADLLGETNNGKNKYGDNYVVFYINVSTESKIIKENMEETVEDLTPRERGLLVGSDISLSEGGVASVAGGAILGGGAGAVLFGSGGGAIAAAAAAGLSVAGKAAIANEAISGKDVDEKIKNASAAGSFSRPQKRLKQVIALHIPNNVNVKYGTAWSEDDTSHFSMLSQVGADVVDGIKNIWASESLGAGADNAMTEGKKFLTNNSSIVAALGLSYSFGKSALSVGTGLSANPKKEQIFDGVDFRTHTFEYQFFPRDEKEAEQIQNIIQTFKYHMHPEFKDASNFLYLYPSEFDITYYKGKYENPYLHKHTSCVLVELIVNYTPNGVFTSFANGMPTQINISMVFKELGILTKERILEGY